VFYNCVGKHCITHVSDDWFRKGWCEMENSTWAWINWQTELSSYSGSIRLWPKCNERESLRKLDFNSSWLWQAARKSTENNDSAMIPAHLFISIYIRRALMNYILHSDSSLSPRAQKSEPKIGADQFQTYRLTFFALKLWKRFFQCGVFKESKRRVAAWWD